jgi:hypothetical protein
MITMPMPMTLTTAIPANTHQTALDFFLGIA